MKTGSNSWRPGPGGVTTPNGAIIAIVSNKQPNPSKSNRDRKSLRDKRIAALSLDLVAPDQRRSSRALTQALLAGELHDAIILCAKADLPMPLASLLRSLIDTAVLGIWLAKYARSEEVAESVASLSTPEIIQQQFDPDDQKMFAFVFEQVKDTDHQFYRDVLHPAIHGDALHLAMRIRDEASIKSWILKCVFHAHHVYCHFLLQFAKSGTVPEEYRVHIQAEGAQSILAMGALLRDPRWRGAEQQLWE